MKYDECQLDKTEKLFRTAHYIAANAKPFTDFSDLQVENNVVLGESYCSDKAFVQFVKHIAGCHFDDLKTILEKSPFISIYCDGTTDNSNSEKEVILIRLLDNYYPKIHFMKLKEFLIQKVMVYSPRHAIEPFFAVRDDSR